MAEVVAIDRVIPLSDDCSPRQIAKMMGILTRQGQIEPLQVHAMDDKFIVWHDDPWANEIVYAARKLGWDTLLIVAVTRYQQ